MNVLIDTPIWSLALRRERRDSQGQTALRMEMRDLIATGRAVILGPIRQEVLSGIRDGMAYQKLRDRLRDFADEPLATEDYEEAARCANICRSAGIASSPVDMLLCAVALRRNLMIFTLDDDFARYARQLRFRLHAGPFKEPLKPK